tara:strand:+ start:505 stop:615 length:111 start_codon:yes stop_codon:yes gene_type:complete
MEVAIAIIMIGMGATLAILGQLLLVFKRIERALVKR